MKHRKRAKDLMLMLDWNEAKDLLAMAMCEVQMKHRKRAKDLMPMLDWNEAKDLLAMAM